MKKSNQLRPFYPAFLDELFSTGISPFEDRRVIPPLNVWEDEKELILEFRIPGLSKEDIHLDYHNGVLKVFGEKSEEKEKKDVDRYQRREFCSYSFQRSFELPEDRYDVVSAQASYKDGILEVTLPKKEQKDRVSRKIEVK